MSDDNETFSKAIFVKGVPDIKKKEFKSLCEKKGDTMSAYIRKFIYQEIERHKKPSQHLGL